MPYVPVNRTYNWKGTRISGGKKVEAVFVAQATSKDELLRRIHEKRNTRPNPMAEKDQAIHELASRHPESILWRKADDPHIPDSFRAIVGDERKQVSVPSAHRQAAHQAKWTKDEDELIRSGLSDEEVAERTGRTITGVECRRRRLNGTKVRS